MQRNRPLGVTIIAILAVIGGISSVLGGLTVLAIVNTWYNTWWNSHSNWISLFCCGLWIVERIKMGLGFCLIVSVIGIIVGLGSIVVGNVGSLFHVIVNAIVIYYLYRPNVKAYFGK